MEYLNRFKNSNLLTAETFIHKMLTELLLKNERFSQSWNDCNDEDKEMMINNWINTTSKHFIG